MNTTAYKTILEGDTPYPVLPSDYCSIIEDPLEKSQIQKDYDFCQEAIDFIYNSCNHKNTKPKLYADPYKKISARAKVDRIIISRGVLDHVKKCIPPSENQDNNIRNNSLFLNENYFSNLALFWIVAHEYYHCYHEHHKLINNYGNYHTGFEYDSDCCATLSLLRYVERKYGRTNSLDEIKEFSLYPIYWCVRTIMGENFGELGNNKTHPSWHLRLYYAIIKIATTCLPNANYGMTPEYQNSLSKLILIAINYENDFLKKSKNPNGRNFLEYVYIENPIINSIEHIKVMEAWDVVFPAMLRIRSEIPAILYRQFPRDYKNMDNIKPYGKKINHYYKATYTSSRYNCIIKSFFMR